ncbi:MAG: type II toxin-antitoxin system HicA family toxin [Rubrivivax sp.]
MHGRCARACILGSLSEIRRLLLEEGWFLVAQRGSHRQYKHESRSGRVTVPGKPSDDLAPGTQNCIPKQAGLRKRGRDALRCRDRTCRRQLLGLCS